MGIIKGDNANAQSAKTVDRVRGAFNMVVVREAAEADPLIAIADGGGVNLFNSQGNAWTADYLKITGELDVDLRSNIAAEARAKIVYERLYLLPIQKRKTR